MIRLVSLVVMGVALVVVVVTAGLIGSSAITTPSAAGRAITSQYNNYRAPQDNVPLIDTFDRATAFLNRDAPVQTSEAPLLDTFDRATALLDHGASKTAQALRDLSDRHTPEELNEIMAGKSK